MKGVQDFEQPTAFYLGRRLDRPDGEPGRPLLLEASDLTTHAVCVGMTGSGKTGLGVGLLEEAALDGIPAIVIDPKGDLGNLLLTFPELRPADFRPWLNPDVAARRNLTLEAYAEEVGASWREGLMADGQGPERIARLRAAAEFRIYTPGSVAGLPISVMQTLAAPVGLTWEDDAEALRERIQSAISALLALVGIEADPVRSREHTLLTNIVQAAWQQGQDIDLAGLIRAVQKPPMSQLGVFDLETFFPASDRMELALALNTIIASPSFAAWLKGEPLDPATLLWTRDGRPCISIFSIAHLDDRERSFFLTLLLEQLVAWMRTQPGSAALRALMYFDELFGYLPPYPKNPPTKRPLLTLLKQARAVGLGLVLATQNPGDLDYKALGNAGIWFVGRLQTERDRDRLLEGLMAISTAGAPLDRGRLGATITALPGRTFIMNDVHRPGPGLFRTRWVMSYLRGPLTRDQIKTLMVARRDTGAEAMAAEVRSISGEGAVPKFCSQCGASLAEAARARFCPQCGATLPTSPEEVSLGEGAFKEALRAEAAPPLPSLAGTTVEPPVLSRAIAQHYLPLSGEPPAGRRLVYEPVVLAQATVAMLDQRRGVDHRQCYLLALEPPREGYAALWETAESLPYGSDALAAAPAGEAIFAAVPDSVNAPAKLTALKNQLGDHLYVNSRVTLFHNPKLDLYSDVGEEMSDFQAKARLAAEAKRDEEVAKLRQRFEAKLDTVEDRLRRERRDLSDSETEYAARKREEALSAAESVLGLFGRRRASTALSRASSKRRMTERARLEIEESEEQIKVYEKELEELQREMQAEIQDIHDEWAEIGGQVEEFHVRPRRADVQIGFVALGWRPGWRD
jgi:hypothetical protein